MSKRCAVEDCIVPVREGRDTYIFCEDHKDFAELKVEPTDKSLTSFRRSVPVSLDDYDRSREADEFKREHRRLNQLLN
jgi:hypothetical protein